jgi:transcriptional regulator with XRE-family HTH domain
MAQLRILRRRRGWTQQQLAAAAGVGEATIARLEAGRAEARPSTMTRIAQALGVRIVDVDEFADDQKPRPR